MNSYDWNVAVIGQFFGMAGLEQATHERTVFGHYYDQVDIFVFNKLADGIKEIVLPDEIELRRIIL